MSEHEINRLYGSNITFLSSNLEGHSDLIAYLKDRGDRLQVFNTLAISDDTDLILIEASFSYFKIFKFLKRLQVEESTACILLMGGDLDVGKVSALLRGGVFDYLKIPFPLQRLGKAIRKGLKNRANLLKILTLSNDLELANRSLSDERDQLKKWNNDLSELYALNQTLSESLHIDEIVKSSIRNIKKVVPHDITCLYLKGWNQVRIETSWGKSDGLIEKISEETLGDGQAFVKADHVFPQTAVRHGGSEIIVNLAVGSHKIGLLRLIRMPQQSRENKTETVAIFNEYQAKILSMISAPLAMAIRNAEMYKQVEDLAVKDALTDVLNRRAFSGILEREFRRATRYDSPLSLMVIDLDYFKKVNDTYGHLAGDQVLREMASTFKSSLRDVDVLVRYGGEEFVVILPGTNLEEALIVANRIKARVEEKIFNQKESPIRMTVSIGVARYPGANIRSPKALFKQADQALYSAKRNGRNCIMILKSLQEVDRNVYV